MNNTRKDFETFNEALDFAMSVNVPQERSRKIECLTAVERQRLAVQRAWVIELRADCFSINNDPACPGEGLPLSSLTWVFSDISSFNDSYIDLCLLSERVKITGFSVYQLHHDSNSVIFLDPLSGDNTLSSQLRFWTGCTYNSLDFHDENDEMRLSAQGYIVHRSTGQRFFIPPVDMDILAECVGGTLQTA